MAEGDRGFPGGLPGPVETPAIASRFDPWFLAELVSREGFGDLATEVEGKIFLYTWERKHSIIRDSGDYPHYPPTEVNNDHEGPWFDGDLNRRVGFALNVHEIGRTDDGKSEGVSGDFTPLLAWMRISPIPVEIREGKGPEPTYLFGRPTCIIPFTHRNQIDDSAVNTVFQNNGTLEIDAAATKKVLLKFKRPIRNPILGIVQFLAEPFASLTLDEFEGLASYTLTTKAEFVTADWDPTTVTWNNQPPVIGGDSLDSHFETDTPDTALESLDTQDLTLKSFLSHVAISPNTSGTLFYGLLMSLNVAAAHALDDYILSQPMRADGEVNFANSFIAG